MVTVRFFAAAREAAGMERVEIVAGPVIPALLGLGLGPRFSQVLQVCSVVSDGYRLAPGDAVPDGATVDVLPPFAGG